MHYMHVQKMLRYMKMYVEIFQYYVEKKQTEGQMIFGLITLVTTGFKDTCVHNDEVHLETLNKCRHNFLM